MTAEINGIPGLPDQPDDIDTNTTDLPNTQAAARRILAYADANGDGLYDACDGTTLYARDLRALALAALGQPVAAALDPAADPSTSPATL